MDYGRSLVMGVTLDLQFGLENGATQVSTDKNGLSNGQYHLEIFTNLQGITNLQGRSAGVVCRPPE